MVFLFMASPHPRPTKFRILDGDTSKVKDPINRYEPKVPVGAPKMPVVGLIDDVAKRKYRSFCKMIDGYGILSSIEQDQVVLFANTWSLYQEAMRERQERGLVVMGRNGPQRNPAVNAELEAVAKLQQMLDRFGLNPSARTRIMSLNDDARDEFDDFVAKKLA